MKFSILMPVYNAEKHLAYSVDSVLNQTYKDFELVLVDDGSTDSSSELCDNYQKQYDNIKVVHQQNQGQLLTRCNAVNASTGDYCLFIDSDDFLVPNALETLDCYISKYNEPDMIIYSFYYEHSDGELEESKPLFDKDMVFESDNKQDVYSIFFENTKLNNVWTKALKRSVFEGDYPDFEKYSQLRCAEDRLHSMAMADNANSILYIPTLLYKYRLVEGSVTRQFSLDAVKRFNTRILYDEEKAYLQKWNLKMPEYQQRLDSSYIIHTLYVFDLFYNKAKSASDKSKLIHYNWTSFVPDELLQGYSDNPYLTDSQKKYWSYVVNKEYGKLKLYFAKKKIIKGLRSIKRKVFK